ncbi:hypothetical protein [Streptomyces sp. B6B3]|uniref:hypothetical protein n=1 Tax=Streptomyces sp. B6B3 TaxID=3153570 RepID=UPI00325D899E
MRHQIRAEYADTETRAEDDPGRRGRDEGPAVKTWHMVREDEPAAMCGRALTPDAAVLSEEEWGRTDESFCHTCGALYLREVP